MQEMYEQKRKEVNKQAEKFEKQMKAAKRSGSKAIQDKVSKGIPQVLKSVPVCASIQGWIASGAVRRATVTMSVLCRPEMAMAAY